MTQSYLKYQDARKSHFHLKQQKSCRPHKSKIIGRSFCKIYSHQHKQMILPTLHATPAFSLNLQLQLSGFKAISFFLLHSYHYYYYYCIQPFTSNFISFLLPLSILLYFTLSSPFYDEPTSCNFAEQPYQKTPNSVCVCVRSDLRRLAFRKH